MWNSRSYKVLLGCCLMLVGAGCVGKTEFHPDTPSGGGGEPGEGTAVVSVRYLKTAYTGYPTPVTKDWEVPGVVTANDRYGSFPNALVVQDGTGGIEIKVSGDELMLAFPIGQRVSVWCQGLVLGGYGGWVSLGTASANPVYQNGFIPQDEIPVRLRKREGIEAMRPDTLRIAELEAVHVGCFIAFENVQFVDGELESAWCDSDADSDRHLVDERGDTLLVRTSRYARFATRPLPAGSGYLEGILGWFNKSYQLRVIDARNAVMDSPRFIPCMDSDGND